MALSLPAQLLQPQRKYAVGERVSCVCPPSGHLVYQEKYFIVVDPSPSALMLVSEARKRNIGAGFHRVLKQFNTNLASFKYFSDYNPACINTGPIPSTSSDPLADYQNYLQTKQESLERRTSA